MQTVHMLFVATSYEGSTVLGVYARKSAASKLCAWCKKNNPTLRRLIFLPAPEREKNRTWKKWMRHFGDKHYPSDSYYVEAHQLQ